MRWEDGRNRGRNGGRKEGRQDERERVEWVERGWKKWKDMGRKDGILGRLSKESKKDDRAMVAGRNGGRARETGRKYRMS